jgi:hypothetical protein
MRYLFLALLACATTGCTRPNESYSSYPASEVSADLGTTDDVSDLAEHPNLVTADLAMPGAGADLSHVKERPDDLGPASCEADGVKGVCLEVGTCAGISTPGHCPGPSDVQCCTQPQAPWPFGMMQP